MNKEIIFNELKKKGLILDGLTADDLTDEKLLELSLQSKPQDQLNLNDFNALIHDAFDKRVKEMGIDQIDRKYFKLPGVELNENEKALPEPQRRNVVFRKFLKNMMVSKTLNSELSSAAGGYTVPEEFRAECARLLEQYGIFRRNCTVINMNSKTLDMPTLSTAPTGDFVTETSAKGESNPVFGTVKFTRHDYAYISGVSNQLLEDTAIDLVGLLAELAASDFARREDLEGFLGSGSPITGWASASNIVEIAQANSKTTFATALDYDMLVEMLTGIPSVAVPGAKWYMHPTILGLIMKLLDSANKPVFADALSRGTEFGNILGHGYELCSNLYTTSTSSQNGKAFIFFGNLKYAYLAQRHDMRIDVSNSATVGSNSAFEKNLTFFRFEESYDIQFVLPTGLARGIADAS